MNKIKSLAGDTVLYGLGSIIPRTLNFFLVVLHTRIFIPEEYSVVVNVYAWVAFLNIVYAFGMETAYFRFATRDGADEQKVFRITQTFVLAISFTLSFTIALFAAPIANYFDVGQHVDFIYWVAAIMFVDAAVSIPFAQLRLKRKALIFASAKIVNVIIVIALNFYFLTISYDATIGVGYVLLANLIANLFYVIFFLRTLVSWRPAMDKTIFSSMFRYAFPIMLTGLTGMINEMFSRITLEAWLPPGQDAAHSLGVFGACFRFAVIMNLAVQAFRFAAEPFFFSHASDKNSPELFAKVNHYFTILCCFILLSVVVNMDILKYLLNDTYWEGLGIVPILLIGYMFLGIYYNMSVWFKLTDKTYFGTIITTGGAVITIVLNYLLIPRFGYIGSSWATLLCYFLMAAACYVLGQQFRPIPYKVLGGLAYLFYAIVLIEIANLLSLPSPYLATGFHFALMAVFLVTVFWRERKYWNTQVG
ncbi:MAG TPA: polysaccharide biosynthesis C-terminal domain-containing protein [Cyclobacteriaceae bacterium]|nr:polysaccharide biosynthesis C-terminal domain-containing protein [Cyclobacteriaceae bacterium]